MDLKIELDKLCSKDFDPALLNIAYCVYDITRCLKVAAKLSYNKAAQTITFYLPKFNIELVNYREMKIRDELMLFSRRTIVDMINGPEKT